MKKLLEYIVNAVIWLYFILMLLVLFILFPLFLLISLFYKYPEQHFQLIMHLALKSFITVAEVVNPGVDICKENKKEIASIRSSILISNHVSYLDGLLVFSLNPRVVVVVNSTFFKAPVLGWMLYKSGAIPDFRDGGVTNLAIRRIQNIPKILESGSNVLVFPEGTRSKTGRLGKFKAGAFKFAVKYKVPLELISIKNANITFKSAKFSIQKNTIYVRKIGCVSPNKPFMMVKDEAYNIYLEKHQNIENRKNNQCDE